MTVYIPTERERDCRRLLDDARELVARLEKIADLAANFLDRLPPQRRERGHDVGMHKVAADTLALLRGKIEDAETLVRQWGK